MNRDAMWVDPTLTERATREAKRLAKLTNADTTDAKEIYRTIMSVAVDFATSQKPNT